MCGLVNCMFVLTEVAGLLVMLTHEFSSLDATLHEHILPEKVRGGVS